MWADKLAYSARARFKILLTLAVFGTGLILGLRYLFPLLAPFLLGVTFACLIEPMVKKLESSFKIRRKLAVGILLIALIVFILSFIYMVTIAFIRETQRLLPLFPVVFSKMSIIFEQLHKYCLLKFPQFKDGLPYFDLNPETFSHILRSIIGWTARLLAFFPQILFTIGLGGVTAYFFCRDKQLLAQIVYRNLPDNWLLPLIQLKDEIVYTLAKFIKTELILVSITAVLTFLLFIFLRLPGALIYGLLAGILDFAPGVGPGLLYIPIICLQFLNKDYYQASGVLIGYFLILFIRQFMEVKIMGENFNFHPLLTIIVIYLGIKFFGFLGIFFGPILIIIMRAFYKVIRAKQFIS